MAKSGRKSLLTEELTKKIEGYAALGVPDKAIYDAAGIGHDTFYRWIKQNSEFAKRLNKARSLGQAKLVKLIWDAVPKTWQAAAWLLERRWPNEYGKKETLKHELGEKMSFAEGLDKLEKHLKSHPDILDKLEKEAQD